MAVRSTRYTFFLLFLIFLCALLVTCDMQREYEAALVLGDIGAGRGASRLKAVTRPPTVIPVTFPGEGSTRRGDLYLSVQRPLAGVLLLPGAAEQGKDDPRLVAFASSLARAGFAVLVPDLLNFRSLQVGSSDVHETARAFSWLAARRDLAPEGRAGIFSFSYASGPAILAALEPSTAGRVRFVMAVGGYHNIKDVLVFFTTGFYREDGTWRHRVPNSYGKWVFVNSNAGRLRHPQDRALLQAIALRKLADEGAAVDDLAARLSPEGHNLYLFIENRQPSRATALMTRLPEGILRELDALDLARRDLSRLGARLILVHGYDDDIVPYTESIALDRAVPPRRARLYLVNGLQHVDLGPRMIIDSFRLWRAISALLAERAR